MLLCLLLLAPVRADRAAMITDLVGSARLGGQPVKTLQVLSPSSELQLESSARVSLIFFQDSHLETLTGPCRVRVEEDQAVLLSGEPDQKATRAPVAVRLPSRGERAETMGGTVQRSRASFLTMPRVLTGDPVFTWTATTPMIVVVTPEKEPMNTIWESQPARSGLPYSGPPLERDRLYCWELRAPGTDYSDPPTAHFVVLSEQSQQEVQAARELVAGAGPDDVSAWVLAMEVYADHEMVDEALQAARRALELRPQDEGLREAVKRLRAELGVPEAN